MTSLYIYGLQARSYNKKERLPETHIEDAKQHDNITISMNRSTSIIDRYGSIITAHDMHKNTIDIINNRSVIFIISRNINSNINFAYAGKHFRIYLNFIHYIKNFTQKHYHAYD